MKSIKAWPFTLIIGLTFTFSILATALVSLFWTPYATDDTTGGRLELPSLDHLLGTDRLGQDLLSQIISGSRKAGIRITRKRERFA